MMHRWIDCLDSSEQGCIVTASDIQWPAFGEAARHSEEPYRAGVTDIGRGAAATSLFLATIMQGASGATLAFAQGASSPVGNCAALGTVDLQTLDEAPTSIMSASVVAAT